MTLQKVTTIDGTTVYINMNRVLTIEEAEVGCVIVLAGGRVLHVQEKPEDIFQDFRRWRYD